MNQTQFGVFRFPRGYVRRVFLLGLCGLGLSEQGHAAITPIAIALTGQAAPNSSGGALTVSGTPATFSNVGYNTQYLGPAMAADGGVAFYSELLITGSITNMNNSGFWTNVDGSLKLVFQRQVTPMPTLPVNSSVSTTFNQFSGNGTQLTFQPAMAPGGEMAFRALSTTSSIGGVYKTSAGTIVPVTQTNMTVSGTTLTTHNNSPAFNDAGNTAYSVFTSAGNSVIATIGGTSTILAPFGGNVVDTSGATISGQTWGIPTSTWVMINSNSDVVFTANTTGSTSAGSTQGGIYSTRGGGTLKAAYNNTITSPVTYTRNVGGVVTNPTSSSATALFSGFGQPAVNSSGDMAFTAVSGASTSADTGFYLERTVSGNHVLSLIAKENDNIATTTGLTTTPNLLLNRPGLSASTVVWGHQLTATSTPGFSPGRPILNDNGMVAFVAYLGTTGTSIGTTPGLFTYADDGTYSLIARSGTDANNVTAPGTGTGIYFASSSSAFRNPAINNRGMVAFTATVSGTGVTGANDFGLWYTNEQGVLTLIAREGNSFSFPDPANPLTTITKTIANDGLTTNSTSATIAFLGGASGTEGHGTGLTDYGIAFGLLFTDGTSGVFTMEFEPVPEPGTWAALSGVAVCGIVALRRRKSS